MINNFWSSLACPSWLANYFIIITCDIKELYHYSPFVLQDLHNASQSMKFQVNWADWRQPQEVTLPTIPSAILLMTSVKGEKNSFHLWRWKIIIVIKMCFYACTHTRSLFVILSQAVEKIIATIMTRSRKRKRVDKVSERFTASSYCHIKIFSFNNCWCKVSHKNNIIRGMKRSKNHEKFIELRETHFVLLKHGPLIFQPEH